MNPSLTDAPNMLNHQDIMYRPRGYLVSFRDAIPGTLVGPKGEMNDPASERGNVVYIYPIGI
jgi:hypothetical protein